MPLIGSENLLAEALSSAATGALGDQKEAWKKVAKAIIDHITANALVTGTASSGGGPIAGGRVT